MSNNTFLVFVYGSLKRGFGNNRLLRDAKYLGTHVTKHRKWNMCSFGGFPGVIPITSVKQMGYHISGELYEVSEENLKTLDMLESNGTFYTRELVDLDDYPNQAWMYVLNDGYDTEHTNGIFFDEDIPSLVWKGRN